MDGNELHARRNTATLPFLIDGLEDLILRRSQDGLPATKVTTAYGAVRRAIVAHELPASHPLDETWLRTRFDSGRTPLREALKRLAHEKFLIWPSHQAPIVRDVGMEELPRLYETRMLLESQVAYFAAQRATNVDDDRLAQILELLAAASTNAETYHSVELDFAFHAAIAQSTQNRFLREASDNLNRQSLRIWFRAQRALGVGQVEMLHRELANAILERDAARAASVAREHVQRSVERQQELQRLDAFE
jgi:DNA-binding GntR family transcriptional regulator